MANFLTYDGHYCYHEGLDGCRTTDEYKKKLGNCGDSCTGLMYFDIEGMYPNAPKLIIERDIEESINTLRIMFGLNRKIVCDMKARLDRIKGMRIAFDEINDKLEEIWSHLIGTPYDKQRGEMLKRMNVQVTDVLDYDVVAANELFRSASCRGL